MESQRYPEDYDGIIAGAPANYWTHLLSGGPMGRASHDGRSRQLHSLQQNPDNRESRERLLRRDRWRNRRRSE